MSKIIDALNQIWYMHDGEQIKVGLTRSFLDGLDECWHILPAANKAVKAKAPLLTVESNDGLVSILSPVTGFRIDWNDRATNFPDKLTEDDTLMTLTTKAPERKEATATSSLDHELNAINQLEQRGIISSASATRRREQLAQRIDTHLNPRASSPVFSLGGGGRVEAVEAVQPARADTRTARSINSGPSINWNGGATFMNNIVSNTPPAPRGPAAFRAISDDEF